MTVTVQRLPLTIRPMPPAVITFPGEAKVVSFDEVDADVCETLTKGLDAEMGDHSVIQIKPVGRFVTYGIGVPVMKMRKPAESIARVPVH